AAGALLDFEPVAAQPGDAAWLAPHQVPAVARLRAILARYGGALLADAVGLGKSYVALAVALGTGKPFALVVPAVLVPQWRSLLARHDSRAPILTHESLSGRSIRLTAYPTIRLLVVDEAHRFRNPETNRYRALARLAAGGQRGQGGQGGGGGRKVLLVTATPVHNRVAGLFHLFRLFLPDHALPALGVPSLRRRGAGGQGGRGGKGGGGGRKVLLVTATPVHNRVAELFHLFRLFLRDHDLTALGVPSLRRAARGDVAAQTLAAVAARLVVARSRARARAGYPAGPVALRFPERAAGEVIRAGTAPERRLEDLVRG